MKLVSLSEGVLNVLYLSEGVVNVLYLSEGVVNVFISIKNIRSILMNEWSDFEVQVIFPVNIFTQCLN